MDVDGRVWLIALATTAVCAAVTMGVFSSKNEFSVEGKTVLITGGSRGLGRSIGRILSQKGANVILVARTAKKLEEAVEYVSSAARDKSNQKFHYISADVTSPSENARLHAEAVDWNNGRPLDVVWANAGASKPALFLDASVEHLRSQMDINYWPVVYLAQHALRSWLVPAVGLKDASSYLNVEGPEESRHFIATSSVLAFIGISGYSPYSPAKAALRSLHDHLRSELNLYHGAFARQRKAGRAAPREVELHTVFPGTILGQGLEEENETKHATTLVLEGDDPAQSADEVARVAIQELEKGRSLITTQTFPGSAMKASSLQGSPRDRWFVDTILSWIVAVVWLFVSRDMDSKVWKWGWNNGLPKNSTR